MSPKFYGGVWAVFAAIALVVFLAGSFTQLAAVIFGSIAFGLIFMGMMCVLPGTVSHPHVAPPAPAPAPKPASIKKAPANVPQYRSV